MKGKEKTKEQLLKELKGLRDRLSGLEQLGIEHKRAEARFRGLLESAPDPIVIVDQKGRMMFANTQAEKLFDYDREELLGGPIEILVPTRLRESHIGHRNGYIANPHVRPMGGRSDLIARRKDGSEFSVEISLSPLETEEGPLTIGMIRDITGRKQAEERLRASEARFRLLAENAQDVIYRYRVAPTRGFEYVSPAVTSLIGYTPEEYYADPDLGFKIVHPDDMSILQSMVQSDDSVKNRIDLRWRRKDGRWIWMEQRNVPIYDESGQMIAIEGVARDVTDRKEAEEALRKSETRNRMLLHAIPDPIFEISKEGVYLDYISAKEFAPIVPPDLFLGKKTSEILPPELSAQTMKAIARALETGKVQQYEYRLEENGELKEYEARIVPDKEESVIVLIREITDRKRGEEALRVQRKLLEEKVQEMDDFIHVVSHDLKEPLRGIDAFAGFLQEDYAASLDEEGKRYLRLIKESAVRMKDLINDLMTLASISRKIPTRQEAELNQLLGQVMADLAFSIQQKGAEIRILSPLPTVSCDPVRIGELFKNLLSNAIKFNAATHPKIDIDVREENGFYLFSFKDNGIGIDPRYADKIFGLFERLHRQEEYEGTGAGLAICKKVIEGCGGKIRVESKPGEGSIFYFTLPMDVKR